MRCAYLFALMMVALFAGCAEKKPAVTPEQAQQQKLLTLQEILEVNRPIRWDAAKPTGPYQVSFIDRSNVNELRCDYLANQWVATYGHDVTILKRTNTIAGTYSTVNTMVVLVYEVHPPK